jgi:hypothetical protein
VFEFEDTGDPVDIGGRYMLSAHGNQWSVPLTGGSACRTVTFYVLIMHADTRSQVSQYEIRADDATETLEVSTSGSSRRSYAVSVTFGGEVEVEMEALYRSSDRIYMQLGGGVVEPE